MSQPLSQMRLRIQVVASSIRRFTPVRWWYKVGFAALCMCLFGAARFGTLAEARGAILSYATSTRGAYLTTDPDTVVVFGPKQFVTVKSNNSINFVESFSVPPVTPPPDSTWSPAPIQYLMRVQRVGGSLTTATVAVNGIQVAIAADFASATYIERFITVNQTPGNANSITISLRGAASAGLNITVVGAQDKSFVLYDPRVFTKTSTTPSHYPYYFGLLPEWYPPYTIAAQASVAGTTASITVNGVQVIKDSDFGTNVTYVKRSVNLLSANNQVMVDVRGNIGTTITLTVTATDKTPPKLWIWTPTRSFATNAATVTVHGNSQNQDRFQDRPERPQVTVNGVVATFTDNDFYATVPVAVGTNTLTVRAIDKAGNYTDSVRTGIRDTIPPTLTLTSPADSSYTFQDYVRVAGTVSDADTGVVITKANGVVVGIGSPFLRENFPISSGVNFLTFTATDRAGNITTQTRKVTQVTDPPVLTIDAPVQDGKSLIYTIIDSIQVRGTVTGPAPMTLTVNDVAITPTNGAFSTSVPLITGLNWIDVVARGPSGLMVYQSMPVVLDTQPPLIQVTSPADGAHFGSNTVVVTGTVNATPGDVGGIVWVTVNGVALEPIVGDGVETFSTQVNLVEGPNTISVAAREESGNITTLSRTVTFGGAVEPPPPDALPRDTLVHAPAVSASVVTTPFAAGAFLYSGSTPLQTGVVAGTIVPRRAAILRGRVLDRDGAPLGGVEVTVLDHPEFGRTETRASGQYDMAVNGGGNLMLSYAKPGVLGALRSVNVPWQDYVVVDDVVLVAVDAQVTQVDLSGGTTGAQVARGSIQTDADGTRQATVLFPEGTTASMLMPDGTSQPLSSLHVRATEYTVGENGRRMMPAPLPPSSGYTYAVELSVDEAAAVGAMSVRFSQTVPFYVDNFLGFPVGVSVPVGVLDRARGVWVPEENGVIIKIVGKTNGLADIDANGDGIADDAAQLAVIGITTEERARLDSLYQTGRSLWRIPLAHFSAIDANFPVHKSNAETPTDDPKAGGGAKGGGGGPNETCEQTHRSSIECETQVLGERIGLVGTPFALHYRSDRAPGHTLSNSLEIPLTDSVVPDGLLRVMLEVSVAGRSFVDSFPAQPNLKHNFVWDGKDAYGRVMTGGQPIMVSLGYVYTQFYAVPADQARNFGLTCRGDADRPGFEACILPASVSSRARQEQLVPKVWHGRIGSFGAAAAGLGGWTLDVHNAYDVSAKELYTGDGHRRRTEAIGPVITTVAGTGAIGHTGDGGPATQARMYYPYGVTATADGSLYITEYGNADLRRVGPDGAISTVATGFSIPTTMSADASGRVYFIDEGLEKVFRFTPAHDGVAAKLETIAGGGFLLADGIPATQLVFYAITGVAVSPDGSLYIADWGAQLVWRVGTDGIATKFAGNMQYGFSGDGGPATQAQLSAPYGPAVGLNGEVYVLDGERIRRIGSDGIITTVAQDPRFAQGGIQLVVGPDGNIYISNYIDLRVHLLKPDGQLIEVAGVARDRPGSPDNSLATRLKMRSPWGISLGPDGSLYIADGEAHKVRVMRQALPGLSGQEIAVASQDGSTINVFDATGLHLRTLDALTRVTLLTFGYDANKQLTTVTDASNNVTSIERDAAGNPVAIIGPFGQRTALNLNTDGLLSKVANPAGEPVTLTYHPGGLLATLTDPQSHVTSFAYDSTGLLTRDQDAVGGALDYVRSDFEGGWEVTQTSTLGRVTKYRVEKLTAGGEVRIGTDPAGLVDRTTDGPDGIPVVTAPDGTTTTTTLDRDLRVGMQAPIAGKTIVTTPGGIVSTVTRGRRTVLSDPANPSSLISQLDSVVANGRVYRNNFVAATNTFTAVTPEGRVSTRQLDALGRVVKDSVAGISGMHYQYDARGRLANVAQGSRTWTYTYGAAGRLASVSDPLSRSTAFGYDSAGRTIVRTSPDGRQLHYAYDGKGNLTSLTPPGRPAHVYDYTSVDNVEDYHPPASSDGLTPTHYSYNLDRQLTQITRPDGGLLQLAYDNAGRLQGITHPTGQISYDYSASIGNLTAITTADNTLGVSYDGSLVTGLTWSGAVGGSVGFGYDNNFRVASLNVNGTNSLALTYDRDGLLVGAGNLTIRRNSTTGRVDSTRLSSVTTVDQLDNLTDWTRRTAQFAGTTLFDASYVRDTLGRITAIAETVSGITTGRAFSYDSAGRLIEVRNNGVLSSTYQYDSNGNRQRLVAPSGTKVGTYDDQDRLLSYGAATYRYTRNGELSTKALGSDTTRYSYDALGNLKAVTLPDGTLVEYVVDGRNRRIGRKVNGVLLRGWLYQDQLNPIAELDGQGNVVTRFVYGTRPNVPDYFIKNGTTYRIIADHLGSVRLVVDVTTGAVAEQIDYDEWGNVTSDSNAGLQPFGFAGGLVDAATNLVRFGVRDYDPAVGRWTTKDPIGFNGGSAGLYTYVDGDPINTVDSRGTCPNSPSSNDPSVGECIGNAPLINGAKTLVGAGLASVEEAGIRLGRARGAMNAAREAFDIARAAFKPYLRPGLPAGREVFPEAIASEAETIGLAERMAGRVATAGSALTWGAAAIGFGIGYGIGAWIACERDPNFYSP